MKTEARLLDGMWMSLPLVEDFQMRRGMHFRSSYSIIDGVVYEPNQGRSPKVTEST
jgi:hypothetical protein